MDVNYLLKDELLFELACRGIHEVQTVIPMRKILREILNRESSGESSIALKVPKSCIDNPVSELTTCEAKFRALSGALSDISGEVDPSSLKRISTRLTHLIGRVKLIIPTEQEHIVRHLNILKEIQGAIVSLETIGDLEEVEDEEISEHDKEILYKSLGEEAANIIEKLNHGSVPKAGTSKGVVGLSTGLPPEMVRDIEDIERGSVKGPHFSTQERRLQLQRSSTLEQEATRRKLVPIKDWGVKFNGRGTLSINAFLERIEELKDARNASDDDLYRYAIDFFEDDALIWFRANRDSVSCWQELVDLLIRSFQRPYYEEELLDEIRKRTQSRHENVLIYISVMQNMFNRLPTKLTDRQKLAILLKNIQPDFQRAVCRDHFNTVTELLEVLRVIEQTRINCENFQEPSQSRCTIEPDLAFQGKEINAIAGHSDSQGNRLAGSMKCWNCRNVGHGFRECSADKQRLFCYKCGRFGSTVKKCPCNNSGNAKPEDQPARGLPQ